MKTRWLCVVLLAGCSATPKEVFTMREAADRAHTAFLLEDAKIDAEILRLYREADEARHDAAIMNQLLSSTDKDGKVNYTDAVFAVKRRQQLHLEMLANVDDISRLRQVNDENLRAWRIMDKGLDEYLRIPWITPEDIRAIGRVVEEEAP